MMKKAKPKKSKIPPRDTLTEQQVLFTLLVLYRLLDVVLLDVASQPAPYTVNSPSFGVADRVCVCVCVCV